MPEIKPQNSLAAGKVRRQAGRKLKPRTKLILAALLLAIILYLPLKKVFIRQIVDYGVTTQGTIVEEVTVPAAVIRQEKVIKASGGGQFTPAVQEWEKVAAGQSIGTLAESDTASGGSAAKIAVRAAEPGLISYHPDGWEGILTVKILDQLDPEQRTELLAMEEAAAPAAVTPGQAVGKIIDNLIKPSLYFRLPADFLKTLPKAGDTLPMEISGGELRRVKVKAIKKGQEELELVAEVVNPCDLELQHRIVQARIIPATYHGIILHKSALVEKDSQPGVMLLDGGQACWTDVEIIGAVGDQVAVEGISPGDLYIQNPVWIRDGQQIE